MWLSDVSVKRPVFATVISLLLVAFGILAFTELPVREYPDISPPVVSVQTAYPGASADVVETQITQPIEDQIAGIAGIRSIESSSSDGRSNIDIEFNLNRNLDEAANDVRDRVARVVRRLPEDIDPPQVEKADADAQSIMWLTVSSTTMDAMALTDYTERYIVDRLAIIPGVASVNVNGAGRPAMRIWLDRLALAARGLAVTDIENALRRENLELPAGMIESPEKEFTVRVARNYRTADEFRQMVLARGADGHLVRLGEVAEVEVAPRNRRQIFRSNGAETTALAINKQSTANTVEVLDAVKRTVKQIDAELPEGINVTTSSDDSVYIRAAINAVYETIAIATVLVGLVTLCFLGTLRSMFIPLVTIPVCLIASFMVLALFGYTVNLIVLLALVLSIGLVVDDSIVVLENVHRRIEEGEPPLLAAFNGARQVSFAVIVTTAVLVAVFVPVIFLKDNIGRLFAELAVTVSAAVTFSAVLALSLAPMLCSKLLRRVDRERVSATRWVNDLFRRMSFAYERALARSLKMPWASAVVTLAVGVCVYALMQAVPQEYAPDEDRGAIRAIISAPEGTSIEQMRTYIPALEAPMLRLLKQGELSRAILRVPGWGGGTTSNGGFAFVNLVPWGEGTLSTQEVNAQLSAEWDKIPGLRVMAFEQSGLARDGGGLPVQFVLGGPNFDELAQWRDLIIDRASKHPAFQRIDSDLKETQPQLIVDIDTTRAAALGISVQAIGDTLRSMMSEHEATTYVVDGEEYEVLVQAKDEQRATPGDLSNIYVRSDLNGALIPLSNLVTVRDQAGASQLNRYNRMRAVTISANLAPGHRLGEALEFLEQTTRAELPETAQMDYKGESLEYKEAASQIYFTFGIALLIVFLVLAAQFESFIHPFVIIMTVPLAIAGGFLGLWLTGRTFNIYSQIGMVMLVGIATKNGILIVDFINQLRDRGVEFTQAILEGARIRFRPVLMTTTAMVMGAVPLMLATGPGAESRSALGVVIFFGVGIAALLTLFTVPAFYCLFARHTRSPNAIAHELVALQTE
jgi:multidrug efflux pump